MYQLDFAAFMIGAVVGLALAIIAILKIRTNMVESTIEGRPDKSVGRVVEIVWTISLLLAFAHVVHHLLLFFCSFNPSYLLRLQPDPSQPWILPEAWQMPFYLLVLTWLMSPLAVASIVGQISCGVRLAPETPHHASVGRKVAFAVLTLLAVVALLPLLLTVPVIWEQVLLPVIRAVLGIALLIIVAAAFSGKKTDGQPASGGKSSAVAAKAPPKKQASDKWERCTTCHGRGSIDCNVCGNMGKISCMSCGGSGSQWRSSGAVTCGTCSGSGRQGCGSCGGYRRCSSCSGHGGRYVRR
ncbi:MAG TPA: hypothetical protein PK264_10950 [Hyphomicrobiaceae bacterium]|nr:hypothetical protein [Hyphomicrobiaceae bacterium]